MFAEQLDYTIAASRALVVEHALYEFVLFSRVCRIGIDVQNDIR